MMLIWFSLPSSNPITLLYTVHPLSDTEPKIGKSRKIENPDFCRSAPPHLKCYPRKLVAEKYYFSQFKYKKYIF